MQEDTFDKDTETFEGSKSEAEPKPITVTWNKKEFEVVITEYVDNKTTCIVLLNPKTSTVEAKATVNLARLPDHLVYIKDYSENRGIAEVLRSHRLISRTGETIRNGSEEFEQHEILPKLGSRYNIAIPEEPEAPAVDYDLGQATKLEDAGGEAAVAEESDYPDPE